MVCKLKRINNNALIRDDEEYVTDETVKQLRV